MDPLALLPYALAAAGGRVDDHATSGLVAAGMTLLQRSAPLVRALAGKRAAVLLPPGAEWLVALAASDGRGLVVFDPHSLPEHAAIDRFGIGAVFTSSRHQAHVPGDIPVVLLDDAPRRALVRAADRETTVDLGSHFALDLVGDSSSPGSEEECLVFPAADAHLTHAALLRAARTYLEQHKLTPLHSTAWRAQPITPDGLVASLFAPLLVGGTVTTTGT